jgi:hypothetical protein
VPYSGTTTKRPRTRREQRQALEAVLSATSKSSRRVRGLAEQAWKNAAAKLGLPYLRWVVVGESGVIDPYGYWRGIREIDEAGAMPGRGYLDRPDAREDYSIEPVPITVSQAEPTTSAPVRSGADL